MNIINVTEEHIPQIAVLEQLCFSTPWTENMLRTQLNDGHIFLAAVKSGNILGYIGLTYVLDEGYISNVAVSPAHRRKGTADALLSALEQRCRALDLVFMTLEVRQSNLAAQRLYEKHGFARVGQRKKYYENPREDAIFMTLELPKNERTETA